mgnify:CR=1 FL=1|jgi:hypothetical protein
MSRRCDAKCHCSNGYTVTLTRGAGGFTTTHAREGGSVTLHWTLTDTDVEVCDSVGRVCCNFYRPATTATGDLFDVKMLRWITTSAPRRPLPLYMEAANAAAVHTVDE